jgi:hypothetical protein
MQSANDMSEREARNKIVAVPQGASSIDAGLLIRRINALIRIATGEQLRSR